MDVLDPLNLLDLHRYPIMRPESDAILAIVADVRRQLADKGCAVLQGFIHPGQLKRMAAETAELAPKAFFSRAQATAYGGAPDFTFAEGHPRRVILERENGFVAADSIGPETNLRQLYHCDAFKRFLSLCLGVERLYEFADPFAQLVVNVVKPNAKHAWHFDSNEFVVTVMTQPAEAGGEFQYVPNLRRPGDERYEDVRAILDGGTDDVHTLDLRPGDLQLFFGRFSLHRVKETRGTRDRHTAVLAYSNEPGVLGKAEKTSRLYGRKLAQHDQEDNQRTRADRLVD